MHGSEATAPAPPFVDRGAALFQRFRKPWLLVLADRLSPSGLSEIV